MNEFLYCRLVKSNGFCIATLVLSERMYSVDGGICSIVGVGDCGFWVLAELVLL
jgi:hypothetical protein